MRTHIFFLLFLFFPLLAIGQTHTFNAGLVSGIWYSKTPFFAGETIRIYTAIQNNSGFDIQGKVRFSKGTEAIGESSFSAAKGGLVQVWTDWKAQEGTYKISTEIIEAKRLVIGKPPESIVLTSSLHAEDELSVDTDTDQDKIGNIGDPDDDNDGLTDEKEIAIGTNPLLSDSDHDGINDKEDTIAKEPETQNQILATIVEQIDNFAEGIVEKLETQKEKLRINAKESKPLLESTIQKIDSAIPLFSIPKEKIPTKEDFQDFLLASIITTISQWRIALLIAGGLLILRFLWKSIF